MPRMAFTAAGVFFASGKPKRIDYIDEGFLISEIATLLSVPKSTIYRRMREYGLSKYEFTEIDDGMLDSRVREIISEFPFCGETMIKQFLVGKGAARTIA